jgi:hypothetical protein
VEGIRVSLERNSIDYLGETSARVMFLASGSSAVTKAAKLPQRALMNDAVYKFCTAHDSSLFIPVSK